MKRKSRTVATVIAAVAFFSVGVIGIQAAPTCERFVREYRENVRRHHVTRVTAARWAAWAAAHPNYHPKPKRRPSLSPQETLKKVAFACQVPTDQLETMALLPPGPLMSMDFNTDILIPLPPPSLQPISLVNVPAITPPIPSEGDVPEPATWVLLGTAMVILASQRKRLSLRAN